MRYREGETLPLASSGSDDMLLLTAVLGVLIGVVLAYLGKRTKQMWGLVWGIGLVLVSIAMGFITWQGLG